MKVNTPVTSEADILTSGNEAGLRLVVAVFECWCLARSVLAVCIRFKDSPMFDLSCTRYTAQQGALALVSIRRTEITK